MKTHKILYLIMAVWMLLATSASAAVAVCHAPCCMPKTAIERGTQSADCHGQSQSSEVEAAAFFASDNAPSASISSDEGGCHVAKADNCVMELNRGGEAVTHNITISLQAPGEALCVGHSTFFPADKAGILAKTFSDIHSHSPPGQAIFLTVSSFLC